MAKEEEPLLLVHLVQFNINNNNRSLLNESNTEIESPDNISLCSRKCLVVSMLSTFQILLFCFNFY